MAGGRSQLRLRERQGYDSANDTYFPGPDEGGEGLGATNEPVYAVIAPGAAPTDPVDVTLSGGPGGIGSILSIYVKIDTADPVQVSYVVATDDETLAAMATGLAAAIDAVTGVGATALAAVITATPVDEVVLSNFNYI